jgi:hypothetical protein
LQVEPEVYVPSMPGWASTAMPSEEDSTFSVGVSILQRGTGRPFMTKYP